MAFTIVMNVSRPEFFESDGLLAKDRLTAGPNFIVQPSTTVLLKLAYSPSLVKRRLPH